MKQYIPFHAYRRLLGCGTLGLLLLGGTQLPAQTAVPVAAPNGATAVETVPVIRARDFLGTDVMSADNRKVGDVVDYAFDTAQPPRLAYVLVMTGGILGVGGNVRAIPAESLKVTGDRARIALTRDQFLALPKLPGHRERFLSDPQNVAQIDQAFHVTLPAPNQAPNIILFSAMRQQNAYSAKHGQIGYIDDVWISPNYDRAPFVEITPTMDPFELPGKQRFALPMARMVNPRDNDNRFTFTVSPAELADAKGVNDTPGVQMVNNGFVGNQVLRVTVPVAPTGNAGQPTGYSTAEQYAGSSLAAANAAQQIRRALDRDSSLRAANVNVVPEGNRVMLSGTVNSAALRRQAEQRAREAAKGIEVDNSLRVQGQ